MRQKRTDTSQWLAIGLLYVTTIGIVLFLIFVR